ncbi:MAG TPA: hypothetical protein VMU81_26155 [Acetobacteraceae bacterium]|nr:hypothetical protein [Acetobacteraceae bacterium]
MATQSRHERGHARHQAPAGMDMRETTAVLEPEIATIGEPAPGGSIAMAFDSEEAAMSESFAGIREDDPAGTPAGGIGRPDFDDPLLLCIREAACAFRDAAEAFRACNKPTHDELREDIAASARPVAQAIGEVTHAIHELTRVFSGVIAMWNGNGGSPQPLHTAPPLQVAPQPTAPAPLTPYQALQNAQAVRAFAQTGRTQLQEAVRLIAAFEASAG